MTSQFNSLASIDSTGLLYSLCIRVVSTIERTSSDIWLIIYSQWILLCRLFTTVSREQSRDTIICRLMTLTTKVASFSKYLRTRIKSSWVDTWKTKMRDFFKFGNSGTLILKISAKLRM